MSTDDEICCPYFDPEYWDGKNYVVLLAQIG